jgi:4-hydroxy-tetrahydrodipicolinate reductase
LGEAVLRGSAGKKTPQYSSIRGGAIVGEHEVIFAGQGETIRLHHSVADRRIFARGAVQAAVWLYDKPPGLYGMEDVLGLKA